MVAGERVHDEPEALTVRTIDEARMSVQRYIAQVLPEPWEVVLTVENETPQRPFAVVTRAGDVTPEGLIGSPLVEAPFAVYAYPPKAGTRREALEAEDEVAEALLAALEQGVGDGRELLIPLWHYGGRPAVVELDVPAAVVAGADVWRIGYDGRWSAPLPRRVQATQVQAAIADLIPGDGTIAPRVQVARLGGPYHLIDDGPFAGRQLEEVTVQVPGGDPVAATVLQQGDPGPWRDPREFLRVSQVSVGGQDDDEDPTMRRVNVSMRVAWGRPARPARGPLLAGVRVLGTGR